MNKSPLVENIAQGIIAVEYKGRKEFIRFPMVAMMAIEERFSTVTEDVKKYLGDAENWAFKDWPFIVSVGLKFGSVPDVTEEEIGLELTMAQRSYWFNRILSAFTGANIGSAKPEETDVGKLIAEAAIIEQAKAADSLTTPT